METKKTKIFKITDENFGAAGLLEEAAQILHKGGTVAFPTETVYGLGANALDANAVSKIYIAKGRPSDNPLIVHIADEADLEALVSGVTETAKKLMDAFWPGPLTLIFDKSDQVPESVTAGLETVAVRMPSHPVARALIKASGVPVAAPSANLSGKPSPTDGAHVVLDLDGRVDAIVCGQSSDVGLESTVLDVTGDVPLILRPGGVTREDIVGVVGACNVDPAIEKVLSKDLKPKSPGMKYTHYAPEADLYVYEGDTDKVTSYIEGLKVKYESQGLKVGIMTCDEHLSKYSGGMIKSLGSKSNLSQMASRLFAVLREFDDEKADIILSEAFSKEGIGHALMNRLLKAAGHRVIQL
ncbi:L-threonylcarbamoyladenylate synthase [Fusibacter sp. JL216-2]|uniref:L-threonylcarbamoyladenylate synthase n=1 Tax=Fusibacter sp. JL216-2 TaxID=3071453 RepID=UPI003D342B2E